MSSLLNAILECTQPNYWDETTYDNVRLKQFSLSRYSHEYSNIRNEFICEFGSNYEITEITRIQHPYAYASCQVRRKQLSIINGSAIPETGRIFLRVHNVNQIDEFLEYNCDERKAACLGAYGPLLASGGVVMVKQIVGQSYKTRSSNSYPDYVIKYTRINLDNLFAELRLY